MAPILRKRAFCTEVGISEGTLNKWLKEGMPYIKVSHGVVLIDYPSAVQWMTSNGKEHGGDAISLRTAARLARVHYETVRYWKRTCPSFAAALIDDNQRYIVSRQRFLDWLMERHKNNSCGGDRHVTQSLVSPNG